ncbi:MAG: hypothetical protein SGJ11_05870 [Phycisphaerae bacterium]|nr:hypothetical protein [Phycisphaerae bacterium]
MEPILLSPVIAPTAAGLVAALVAALVVALLAAVAISVAIVLAARMIVAAFHRRSAPQAAGTLPAPPIDSEQLERLRAEIKVLTHRVEAMEDAQAESAWIPAVETFPVAAVDRKQPRQRGAGLISQVRVMTAEGREPVEIARTLGVDLGEIELIVRLAQPVDERAGDP